MERLALSAGKDADSRRPRSQERTASIARYLLFAPLVVKKRRVVPLCSSAVFQDVDQAPERITDVEGSHAPWLSHRTVFDFEPCRLHPPVDVRQVVDLYGEVGYRCSRPALGRHADLRGHSAFGCKGHDPPEVHNNVHPERVTVKGLR